MTGIICPACGGNDINELETYDSDIVEGIVCIRQSCVCNSEGCGIQFDAEFVLAGYDIPVND